MKERAIVRRVVRARRSLAAGLAIVLLGAAAWSVAPSPVLIFSAWSMSVGSPTAGTVKLSAPSASVVVVTITSSNPEVVSVSSGSVPFQPNSVGPLPVVVNAVGPGCAELKPKIGTAAGTSDYLVVNPASTETGLTLTLPENLLMVGGQQQASVRTSDAGATTVALVSSNTSVARVPATVTLTRGAATFTVSGGGPTSGIRGCAMITASYVDARRQQHKVSKYVHLLDIGG